MACYSREACPEGRMNFSLANMLHLKDAASLMKLSLGRLEGNPALHVYVRELKSNFQGQCPTTFAGIQYYSSTTCLYIYCNSVWMEADVL